jgi:regulator of protease activity HflC (stomatin/prohibitin superfamily)
MKVDLWPVDGSMPPATSPRWRRFIENYLPKVVIYLMVATLVAIVLYPHMVVTVPSGQVGVLWKRFGGGTVLDPRKLKNEGFNLILPWNQVFLYDLRLQSFTESYNAISSDGVSLAATIVVRFRLQRDSVPVLHQAIGPNYERVLVQPGIGSLTRQVIAEYTAEQAYSTARQEIQDKIRSLVEERLSQKMMEHAGEEGEESYSVSMSTIFILYDVLVTGIELPAAIVAAINRKTEQYYIAEEYKFRVEREKRESERKKIEAEGIRDFQQTVSQGISESYLRWRGIEATLQLSQSTNAKVVVIGSGKDGLPIILGNVDTPAPPARSTPAGGTDTKESTTAAGPAVPLEKTPAAGLATPTEKTAPASSGNPPAAAPDGSRSFWPNSWPITLSDIENYLSQMVRPTEREAGSRQPPEGPAAEQAR